MISQWETTRPAAMLSLINWTCMTSATAILASLGHRRRAPTLLCIHTHTHAAPRRYQRVRALCSFVRSSHQSSSLADVTYLPTYAMRCLPHATTFKNPNYFKNKQKVGTVRANELRSCFNLKGKFCVFFWILDYKTWMKRYSICKI